MSYDRTNKLCFTKTNVLPDFPADICYDPATDTRNIADICTEKFCTPGPDAPGLCVIKSATRDTGGVRCQGLAYALTNRSLVSWAVHGEECTSANGAMCTNTPRNEPHNDCEFVSTAPLETLKAPPAEWISRAVHVDPVDLTTVCVTPSPFMRAQWAGPIGTASAAGTSTNITAVRGLATVGQSCGSDGCFPGSLDTFNTDLADSTVAGIGLTNASVSMTQPAPLVYIDDGTGTGNLFLGIASGALELRVTGKKGGVDSYYAVRNKTPWRLDTTATTFHLTGSFAPVDRAADGTPLQVTVTADITGVPATAQTIACANATSLSRLFGFEDTASWSSSSSQASLGLVTSPITQGCAALGLRGQGFMPIDSAQFSTRGLVTNAAASVDLFVPSNQPNQFWTGQLQLYLSCPSGNFFHQFVGQADITGKSQNKFSTMRIPLTSAARTVLGRTLDDCSFQYALNVNGTNRTWVFDNLRFTP